MQKHGFAQLIPVILYFTAELSFNLYSSAFLPSAGQADETQ
jgi:hypothetical protein